MSGDRGERTQVAQALAASPSLVLRGTCSPTEPAVFPPVRAQFQAILLMCDQNQVTVVAGGEPRDRQPRVGHKEMLLPWLSFSSCGHSGGENPATVAF